jgi:predicted  nucleic acid-binding Zn-ribbon protein
MSPPETLSVYLFGSVLVGSAVLAILLQYYSQKARGHFTKAEERIEKARKALLEAKTKVHSLRAKSRSKTTIAQVEKRISRAIDDLLSAAAETEKASGRTARR